jgi:hypothetical protein
MYYRGFINGVAVQWGTGNYELLNNNNPANTSHFRIGATSDYNKSFPGFVSMIRLWNTVIGIEDICYNLNRRMPYNEDWSFLDAYWGF